jgi:hypothetical protein
VTDYGVRLTVRVGIIRPAGLRPFQGNYTIYSLTPREGSFQRPFLGFSAPRYVSTTFGLTCRNQRIALQFTASHPVSNVRTCQLRLTVIQGCLHHPEPPKKVDA